MCRKPDCKTCEVEMAAKNSNAPARCKWYIDNVVIAGKSVKDCPIYKPTDKKGC